MSDILFLPLDAAPGTAAGPAEPAPADPFGAAFARPTDGAFAAAGVDAWRDPPTAADDWQAAPDTAAAVRASHDGRAAALAGSWDEAAAALRASAERRAGLVARGLADPAVAVRGWSDVAVLAAACDDAVGAAEALARARAAGDDEFAVPADVDAALAEVAAWLRTLGGHDTPADLAPLARTPVDVRPADLAPIDLSWDEPTHPAPATLPVAGRSAAVGTVALETVAGTPAGGDDDLLEFGGVFGATDARPGAVAPHLAGLDLDVFAAPTPPAVPSLAPVASGDSFDFGYDGLAADGAPAAAGPAPAPGSAAGAAGARAPFAPLPTVAPAQPARAALGAALELTAVLSPDAPAAARARTDAPAPPELSAEPEPAEYTSELASELASDLAFLDLEAPLRTWEQPEGEAVMPESAAAPAGPATPPARKPLAPPIPDALRTGAAAGAAPGGARNAAVDAVVALTEASTADAKPGKLGGLLRRLTGR